jgi:hypothetical protein
MKKLFFTSACILSFSLLILNTSCGNKQADDSKKVPEFKADTSRKDTVKAQAYVCPMGATCGQGNEPGKCPSCGMTLVENKDFKKPNHE